MRQSSGLTGYGLEVNMEWIAYCTVCGEISRGPNGTWEEAEARVHRRNTGHVTIVGYEPPPVAGEETTLGLPSAEAQGIIKAGPEAWAAAARERFGRPPPQTYGDWVDLAEAIKDITPLGEWDTVNKPLQTISEEGPGAEEAKRWLVEKARELGIA